MKKLSFLLTLFLFLGLTVNAQEDNWPKQITTHEGLIITIYQPQPEKLTGNKLSGREAISVRKNAKAEPVFGAVWFDATLQTDRDSRMATLESVTVTNIKFPDQKDDTEMESLKKAIETEAPKWDINISMDRLLASIENENNTSGDNLSTAPPKIIYKNTLAALILIDGDPIVKQDDNLKMERVLNTPYLMVKDPDDKQFYLSYGNYWYKAGTPTAEKWETANNLPAKIKPLDTQIKEQAKKDEQKESTTDNNSDNQNQRQYTPAISNKPVTIVVSTVPAELIATDGEPNFRSIRGTSLLYASNTDNQLFKDINTQQNYVLLSGRWYASPSMTSEWKYVPSDKLPADFAKIPEGSAKDGVLANVAGTSAAEEAKMDAQIPQTAKVDRKTATCTVTYDGSPKFEKIEGTSLEVAVNTSSTVLKASDGYYCVENGVWFFSKAATGPWSAATKRPEDVDKIPPQSQAYNVKYVYVYDVTPDYIYMGYTPGYLGCYIFGPTIVYGTGFYYHPWYGAYYYPRPVTWGFGVSYNPWTGWNMSFGVSVGFFHFAAGTAFGGWAGGWFGPPVYHPPYRPWGWNGGYYGPRNNVVINNNINVNVNHTNNLYNYQRNVVTHDVNRTNLSGATDLRRSENLSGATRSTGNLGQTRQTGTTNQPRLNSSRQPNNVYTDRNGNVYQRNQSSGEWNQRQGNQWKPVTPQNNQSTQNLNRENTMRQRGQTLERNFNNQRMGGFQGGGRRR